MWFNKIASNIYVIIINHTVSRSQIKKNCDFSLLNKKHLKYSNGNAGKISSMFLKSNNVIAISFPKKNKIHAALS